MPTNDNGNLAPGDMVRHDQHGIGQVVTVERGQNRAQALIKFGPLRVWVVLEEAPTAKIRKGPIE